ncbi:HEXXH motif-containing putative peptide modification protein [Streptomyces sp. VNUA116]|uniref:aKG-HExxH-type peptide beta-hydroxylase n=1 Tax=Streptomyces sp. VNUA116 TaxID=3062449 RepID=UPI002676E2B6|nr:HEXXH motif-containing putative peptide modification protein [Streptomyces sp. VNUA116]WKU48808.1 HEXXH motif-containing putative peptide modification protein [Streptomyces sp. VNUA116]
MTPLPHRFPGALFDAVASGGGGAEALGLLARAEHTRRLAAVYAVTDAARGAGGAVAREAERAWELLVEARRAAPGATDAVLTHPSAGPALLGLLTRLARPSEDAPPVHWFTALAAAAAVRAALPARVQWPVAGPRVALPSLGRAHFPAVRPGDHAELRVDAGGRATIGVRGAHAAGAVAVPRSPYATGDRWQGAHLLTTLETGAALLLDFLDPPSFPRAASRPDDLGPGEARRWAVEARRACRMLRTGHPEVYEELAAGPWLLVPLSGTGRGVVSGSSAETFGCIALSPPPATSVFAVTLAHEIQHNKFAAMLHLFDLFEAGDEALYYAPWRPDPRPLLGLFHGAYAHLGVAQFWGRRAGTEPDPALRAAAQTHFARWRSAARDATLDVLGSGRLTPLGERFAGRMLETLDALCRAPVPASALHHAESAARAHRTAWRNATGKPRTLPV